MREQGNNKKNREACYAKLQKGHKRVNKYNHLHIQSKLTGLGALIEILLLTQETDICDLMEKHLMNKK